MNKEGLDIPKAILEDAQVTDPEDATTRDNYTTPDFERQVTIPDRVELHCNHLSNLLRLYGRMEKTMVFYVSQEHALQVTKYLIRLNQDLNVANYAVRIVSEESDAQAWLEKFQAVEKPIPVVASTVDSLTTGVDAPSVRNVVFFKTILSPTMFKLIVGCSSRLCEDSEKYWFRIIDYTGATDLFDEWDRPTSQHQPAPRCLLLSFTSKVTLAWQIGHLAWITVTALFLSQRRRWFWLALPIVAALPSLLMGWDFQAALAAFLAVGITVLGFLVFGRSWWGSFFALRRSCC